MPLIRGRRQTLKQAKIAAGCPLGNFLIRPMRVQDGGRMRVLSEAEVCEREDQIERETMVGSDDAWFFLCGLDVEQCGCGRGADVLCDYPIGEGKTCDIRLCETCAAHVGVDHDLCQIHEAQFTAALGIGQQPWLQGMWPRDTDKRQQGRR